jgi:hypothetical protein
MKLKHRQVPFQVKEVTAKGEFSGHASVFDVVDWYRDVVKPGAFERTLGIWAVKKALPPVLWQHDTANPIGPHLLMREEEKGLYVEGELLVDDVPQAKIAHALLKRNVIRGMSIGYDLFDGGMEYDGKTNVWNLTAIDLWENSIVTFPANEEAAVEAVKSVLGAGKLPTLSEFEGFLREAGFSKSQATAIAGRGLRHLLQSESDAGVIEAKDFQPLLEYLNAH